MDRASTPEIATPRPQGVRRFLQDRIGSDLGRSFATGSSGALALRLAGTGLTLLLQLLLTRVLGPSRYGDYVYALSWVTLLASAATVGLDTAALRYVAAYAGSRDWALLRGFARRAVQLTLIVSLALAALLAGIVLLLRDDISRGLSITFLAAALLLPVIALLQLLAACLQGLKEVLAALAPQWVLRPLLLGLTVLVVYRLADGGPGAPAIMLLDLAGTLALVVGVALLARRRLPPGATAGPPSFFTRRWLATGLSLLAITGIRLAMNKADVLMIGLFLGTTPAGIYALASQLATLISLGLLAVNMIAAPLIAQLHVQGRRSDLRRLVRLCAQGAFLFSVTTGCFLLLFGRLALGLFGPAFVAGYRPLVVLIVGQIANSLSGSVGFLMAMTGHEREAAKVTAFAGVLNVLLNLYLIPRFGPVGAAISTVAATTVWNVALILAVKRRLDVNPTIFDLRQA